MFSAKCTLIRELHLINAMLVETIHISILLILIGIVLNLISIVLISAEYPLALT